MCCIPYGRQVTALLTGYVKLTGTAIRREKARGSVRHISSQITSKHHFTNKFMVILSGQC